MTKQAIKDLFGQDEDLLEALDDVEGRPQSNNRRKMLEEQLEKVEVAQNQVIYDHLTKLEALLIERGLYSPTTYTGTQSGSGALAQWQGATAISRFEWWPLHFLHANICPLWPLKFWHRDSGHGLSYHFFSVMPAKAGIQGKQKDPGFPLSWE